MVYSISFGTIVIIVVAVIVVWFFLAGIRFIPNNRIGIVEKRFGGRSVKSGLSPSKERQVSNLTCCAAACTTLYRSNILSHLPLVTITQGKIGYIFARDGEPLSAMQVLATNVMPTISRM